MTDASLVLENVTDGRHAWRERNRNAVVDALLDLYNDGVVTPSADEIAERSGVSRRSLFRYFDDMDELARVATSRQYDRVSHLFPIDALGEGALPERIDRLIAQRIRLFAAIGPVARIGRMRAPLQPVIAEQIAADSARLRRQLERHLAPELDVLSAEARAQTLAAADVLTSFESYELLTRRQGLPPEAAGDVMRCGLSALFTEELRGGTRGMIQAPETKNTVRYGRIDTRMIKSWMQLPPEGDGPFWAVNLMKYREIADYGEGRETAVSGREADDEYTPRESLRAIGAQIVFAADVDAQLLGATPLWDRIGIVKYPSRRAFIEMQSRPDFMAKHVHKDAGMEQTIVMACQPMPAPPLPADAPDWTDVPHPPTAEDASVVIMHVLKFFDVGTSVGEMSTYTDHAGKIAVPHGVRIDGWFTVEGTIVGDGRSWSQVRFNAFPSKKAFMAVVTDPERLRAQRAHRETALEDTYTMILRPTINRLAESVVAEARR